MRQICLVIAILGVSLGLRASDPIEGRWHFGAGGATFEAVEGSDGVLELRWISGSDLTLEPGIVIGRATAAYNAGQYNCTMYKDPRSPWKGKKKGPNVVLTLSADARKLSFNPYNPRRRVSFWRWIPYFFRVTVLEDGSVPQNLDAATRVDDCPDFLVL